MGRCGTCQACLHVIAYKARWNRKRNDKKVKRYAGKNPCKQTTASSSKRRLNELDNLSSMGHGGQVRWEILPVRDENDIQMDRADIESCPTNNMNDNDLDADAFDKY